MQTIILVIGKTTFLILLSAGIIIIISLICFLKNLKQIKIKKNVLISLFLILLYIPAVNIHIRHKPFMIELAEKIFSKQKNIIKNYDKKYSSLLNHYSEINKSEFIFPINDKDIDIYFIHLESINSLVVNQNTMPKLLKYSDRYGVRFDNFLSNTTQTIRTEESILCSIPPIIAPLKHGIMENIICLPKILEWDGYKTIFFKAHDLEFSDTGKFMKKIGFSENHNKDIMRKGDPELNWGYREDIFYKRIYEYLKKYKDEKKFIYIATSASGHIPFEENDKFDKKLPFENNGSLHNAISNSAYIQDYYLNDFLKKLIDDKRKKYIFIYSDNAHPIYLKSWIEHKSYKENFSIPFVFLSINNKNNIQQGKIVNSLYSQIDIFSTLLDLLDIKMKKGKYISNSFYNELIGKAKNKNENCVLSIQPFGNQYLNFFMNHYHYIYDIYENKMVYYNTKTDPFEKNEIQITNQNTINKIYNKCANFIH
ncbi:MAG: LTA synthase family protein [Patescibacteria group bacterium]|nr:LTA synthase family protein [Patescibacteria group bacterium]